MPARSNLEMVQLKLIKSVFVVNAEYPPTDERVAIGVSLKNNGEFQADGRLAHFTQRLTTGHPTTTPFFLDVEFGAAFLLDPTPLPLERPHYVKRVFPQIVFPYMREYVAETTRRGGFTPLIVNQAVFDEEPESSGPAFEEQKWAH